MTSPTSEPMTPELMQIKAEAEAIAPPPVVDPNAPPAAAPVDFMVDARGLCDFTAEGLGALYPSTLKVLDAEKRERFAAALAPVMEKYGLSLGAIFGRWGAEINLAFVTVTLAVPLANAIKSDRAAIRAEQDQAERATRNPDPQPERPAADPYTAAFAESDVTH